MPKGVIKMKISVRKYFLLGTIALITAGLGKLNAAAGDGGKSGKASTAASDSGSKSGKKASLAAKKEKDRAGLMQGLGIEDIKKSTKADEEKILKIRQREKARAEVKDSLDDEKKARNEKKVDDSLKPK